MEESSENSPSLDLERCLIIEDRHDQQNQHLLDKRDQILEKGGLFSAVGHSHLSNMPKHPFEEDVLSSKVIPEKQRKWWKDGDEANDPGAIDKTGIGGGDCCEIYDNSSRDSMSGSGAEQSSQISNFPNTTANGEMFYIQGEDSVGPVWLNYDTELKPISHLLLSPRNSNGSICSNRSSNADSAVELLTPDEEQQTDHLHNIDWYRDHYRKTHQQLSTESGIDFQILCKTVPSVVVSDHSGPNVSDTGKTLEKDHEDTSSKSSCLSVDHQLMLGHQQSLDRQTSVDSEDSPYSSTSMSCRSNSSNSLTDLTDFDEPIDEVQELKPVKRVSLLLNTVYY